MNRTELRSPWDDALEARSRPVRSLFLDGHDRGDGIFFHEIWFRQAHNNVRYEMLLPRLERVEPHLALVPRGRIPRGVVFRALRSTRKLRYRALFPAASRRYRFAFCSAIDQVQYFRGKVVVDIDDPRFSAAEVRYLNHSNVAAYVVTAEFAGRRFEELGVRSPFHVIPQAVRLDLADDRSSAVVAERLRRPGDVVVGFVSAWLLTSGDRGGDNPLYNIDHLLELWDAIHERLPTAKLWLVGQPSKQVRQICADRSHVLLLGRLSQADVVSHVTNFDIALYPRTGDGGVRRIKVAEYMGLGVPTVGYVGRSTQILAETGAGWVVETADAFVDAVLALAHDEVSRRAMGERARAAGADFHVDEVARRYRTEILDRYLI